MQLTPIGTIHSPFRKKDECPIQPVYADSPRGSVQVYDRFAAGLKDIETFSHLYLLYLFDRSGDIELVRKAFLDDEPHGIFASRHPCRPNGIGMSIVRLIRREGSILDIEGVDVLDATPLIDIKPYIPRFDLIRDASEGWLAGKNWRPKPEGLE